MFTRQKYETILFLTMLLSTTVLLTCCKKGLMKSGNHGRTAASSFSDTGDIYGCVDMEDAGKVAENLEDFHTQVFISIPALNLQTHPDKDGFFYFSELPVGKYNLEISKRGFRKEVFTNVDVAKDFISIVYIWMKRSMKEYLYLSRGMKVKRVDLNKRGSIAGKIEIDENYLSIFGKPKRVGVEIHRSFWKPKADTSTMSYHTEADTSTMTYYMDNVLIGIYAMSVEAWPPYYGHKGEYTLYGYDDYSDPDRRVRVAPDSVTFIDFSVVPIMGNVGFDPSCPLPPGVGPSFKIIQPSERRKK